MKYLISLFFISTLLVSVHSCGKKQDNNKPAGPGGWLKGNSSEKFETIAEQLRGLDMTMVEVGYRYQELYWAGKDENWDYASYQVAKLELALKSGFERRPLRAESGKFFLNEILPGMKQVILRKDTGSFAEDFLTLTSACNSCHKMEKVPFFNVKIPVVRQSAIQK